ncbi:MAG: DUF885 family protein, partial [Actinobacteria bacterium]|nr:DUF885 family protein [Actinomycetota bacterium]
MVELDPLTGTYIGRGEADGRLPDFSPAGAEVFAAAERQVLADLEETASVDAVDEVTRADLSAELRLSLAQHEAGESLRDLNVIESPAQMIRDAFDLMSREDEQGWAAVAERMRAVPASL